MCVTCYHVEWVTNKTSMKKTSGYATMVHGRGVQSASLYYNFRKPGNYVIMTS